MKEKQEISYDSMKVGAEGQIVIPTQFRKEFDIKEGDNLIIMGAPEQKGFAVMKPEGMQMLKKEIKSMQQQISKEEKK